MATSAPRPLRSILVLIVLIVAMLGSVAVATTLQDDDEGNASFVPGLALDLEGGVQLILTPRLEGEAEDEITDEDIDQAIEIIRQRVDASGVAEAEITRQGAANIVVGIPGTPDAATLDLVRQSATMRFRPVLTVSDPSPIDPEQDAAADVLPDEAADVLPDEATGDEDAEQAEDTAAPAGEDEVDEAAFAEADRDGDGELSTTPDTEPANNSDPTWITEQAVYDLLTLDCTDPANLVGGEADDPSQPVVACDQEGLAKYVLGPVDVEGIHVDSATSGLEALPGGGTTNNWVVNIEFDSEGTAIFRDVSQRLYNNPSPQNQFAIVLDGLVVSAPSMNAPVISDGRAQISGNFTRESANTLANQLNFGSLPLNFEVQSEEQISATLGSEHLRNGLIAGVIGLVLVALYLVWQYRAMSVVAIGSLVVAALATYGAILVLSWVQGYRLSLAGVAGLIVAIGITADSFILYFERVRDEIREGRGLQSAIEQGWTRAKRTIIIADLVTLLAAVILYFLAVGGVRGFAFTLGLTTVIDLVVVFLFTRPMFQLVIRTRFFGEGHRLSGLNPESIGGQVPAYRGRGRVEPRPPRPSAPRPEPGAKRQTIAERRAAERAAAEAATATSEEDR
ncbi:MAG TPA: protein translocase subunit SecD [Actinomycetaceae bacterium]|nr:protein translocase subunit SecD [Actinomycetaceae bacterium]